MEKRRYLELGLYRWTTSEDYYVLERWVGSRMLGVKKGPDGRIDEDVLRWFGHVERMENDRIAQRIYVGESFSW